ncbi:MAG: AraC family transcriptional regulator, partial [Pseudomonadota bacterium]
AGAERFRCDGRHYVARPGQLCLVHPGQVHDGGPADIGFTYRMFYPSVSLLTDRAYELRDGRDDMPSFASPVITDPALAQVAVQLHKRLEMEPDSLAIDQALEHMLAMLIDRQLATENWRVNHNPDSSCRQARAYLDANYASDIGLDDLAEATNTSRYQILRRFKAAYGLTPHAYLIDCRVRAARRRLAAGEAPADVATDCGFYDQSHLNRAFKSRVGTTPARYRGG